jgi:uncharacterized protein (DUF58 family)
VRYRVENRSRLVPVMAVSIIEHLETSPDPQHHQAALDVDPAMAGPKGPPTPQPMRAEILHVPARSEIVVEGVVRAAGRGVLRLRGYEVVTTFPFGIIKKHLWYDAPTSAIIQPASEPVDATIIDRRGGLSSSGDSGRVVGRQGEEFVGLREYAPGDSPKLVAWRASAALPPGELLVRQIATGTPKKVWVRLSLRRADAPADAERAISQAAAFLRLANQKRMQVGLSIWTDWGHVLDAPPGSHGGRAAALINDLALLPIGTEAITEHAIPSGVVARRGVADVIIEVSAEGWSGGGVGSSGWGARSRGRAERATHASPAEVTPA